MTVPTKAQKKTRNSNLNNGLLNGLCLSTVGNKNITAIAPPIKITPPVLFGTARKIA